MFENSNLISNIEKTCPHIMQGPIFMIILEITLFMSNLTGFELFEH